MSFKDTAFDKATDVAGSVISKRQSIDIETIIRQAIKLPLAKINRAQYLTKELSLFYPTETVNIAIQHNPAYADIDPLIINSIAQQAISYETSKVATISFASGVPGGVAGLALIPADILQYFTFILRIMQKLAYLYGFPDMEIDDEHVNDDTLNQILVFLGVMTGVQEANALVKAIAKAIADNISKNLAKKALTKGTIYPIIKQLAKKIGVKMTKQFFADGVSKVVPILGGAVSGTLSYVSFKLNANRLQDSFKSLPIANTDTYKRERACNQTSSNDSE